MCVLDVGCGAGAVSIPAARAVAPGGRVTGIDLAGPMLTRARQAALAEGLTNVVFLNVDASEPSFGPASLDAVLASFVVYLLADPAATVARWRNLLRPGGILAFTWVIAEDSRLEPVYAAVDEFLPDGQEGWNAFRKRHELDVGRPRRGPARRLPRRPHHRRAGHHPVPEPGTLVGVVLDPGARPGLAPHSG